MKLEGEYIFNGPREKVWKIVRDPEVLATALPGTQTLNRVGENEYEGAMHVRIGPVAGDFAGRLIVSDEVPPERCTLTVEGRGAAGFATGTGHVYLLEQEDGTTLLQYDGEMQIGGKLAGVGQRLLDTASKSLIRQGLEALNNALQAQIEAETTGKEVEYVPPTEARFAAAVVRDMAREMAGAMPPPQTMAWIGLVAAVALLIGFLLGKKKVRSTA